MKEINQVKSDFLKRRQMFRRLTIIFWANVVVCIGLIVLYILIHFPQSIVVYPVKKVYAIGDMSTDYYEVVVNPVIGKSYVLDNPNIDVKLDVDDYYEVTAHYFGLTDTVKVKPIAQSNVVVEYADKVYFGDKINKSRVKCYAVFEDGYEQDIPMTCQIPEGPVTDEFTIVVKTNDAMVHLLDIIPISIKGIDAEYNTKLYDGDKFSSKNVSVNVVYEDGFKRKLSDFTWNGNDDFVVDADFVGNITTSFGTYDVTIKIVGVKSFTVVYNGVLYAGDSIDANNISLTKVYTDGTSKDVSANDCDFSNLTYAYANMSERISTNVGNAVFEPKVTAVRSVVCNLPSGDILEGSNISPISFDITFVDGHTLNVGASDVKLSSDWTSAKAGAHDYSFTYHGNVLTCSVVAKAVQNQTQPSVSVPQQSTNDVTIDMNVSDDTSSNNSSNVQVPSDLGNEHEDGYIDTYDVDTYNIGN